ncbi:putative glycosyltransferase involved in capsule biosynthesis [Bacillus fengqiuensis]|nr:putative glycosyltransferase involved in capsule biosynthesis [Bacillus fengqiuensis]
MFEQVSILLPFKTDNGIRHAELQWVIRFYYKIMPGVEICVGENFDEIFSRSKAINAAARKATRNVYVLADCDVIYDPDLIVEALHLLQQAPWVIPFNRVLDISKEKTEKLIQTEPEWPLPSIEAHCQEGFMAPSFAGKINIFSREAFENVGGFDERFVGWGGEDDAFVNAMNTLCGPFARLNKTIYHLWHPFAGHSNPHYGANLEIVKSYLQAYGNQEAMKRLIRNK